MKSIRKYLPLFAMLLLFIKPFVAVAVSTQGSVEEVIIKNGEFNEGLKDSIVSSPGENNPSLVVDSNGNQYVKATNGENILQYVQLKPNSTYRFAYYVIGDPVFPAIVEFGTLNHDQGYHPLKEEKHYNIAWKQHELFLRRQQMRILMSFALLRVAMAKLNLIISSRLVGSGESIDSTKLTGGKCYF